ncbi:GlxA family transcriptional regulator [Pseudorhodoplanes sp.]|uniref:GlxA family transcriptional regulator n=1 Tax=Pseudorhodoplanes sp. TaxID=1934341 RepID=UPI003D0FB7D0
MPTEPRPLHVSLVAVPEAAMSTLVGIYDVLNAFGLLARTDPAIPDTPPFAVDIVGTAPGEISLASGLPLRVGRAAADIAATDIVLVPSVVLGPQGWKQGRYPDLVDFAARMHRQGAILCSACSGIFLLAETGLFDGHRATVHWGYAREFEKTYPLIHSEPERVLVAAGERQSLISSGASTSWHDLVLYLIVRFVGAPAAQAAARFFALQWHQDGLAPYIVFEGRKDHGDAAIAEAQTWLASHFSVVSPVEEMVRRSGLAERTFKRRFTDVTGLSPIEYVQRLRIEDAKRRLERTDAPVDEIGWRAGYEDAAFFRRLFKRLTGLSPGAYRKRFRVPQFARGGENQ